MENIKNHENSRKVFIRRSAPFIARAQNSAKDFYDNGAQSVGSYFETVNSKRVASGLTMAEENLLIPAILGLHHEDRDYFKERNLYFANFETKIPPKNGLELEVGLTESNSKPLSSTNLPLNVMDYLRFKHASGHPWVSASRAGASGNQLKQFFIFDEVAESGITSKANDQKDKALEYYLKVKADVNKVNMMLLLLGTDYRDIVGQNDTHTAELRGEKLRELSTSKSTDLVSLYEDKDFDAKYSIEAMMRVGVIRKISGSYRVVETDEFLGRSIEEVVYYFKDEDQNSATISLLKEKMQEGMRVNKKAKSTKSAR